MIYYSRKISSVPDESPLSCEFLVVLVCSRYGTLISLLLDRFLRISISPGHPFLSAKMITYWGSPFSELYSEPSAPLSTPRELPLSKFHVVLLVFHASHLSLTLRLLSICNSPCSKRRCLVDVNFLDLFLLDTLLFRHAVRNIARRKSLPSSVKFLL